MNYETFINWARENLNGVHSCTRTSEEINNDGILFAFNNKIQGISYCIQ